MLIDECVLPENLTATWPKLATCFKLIAQWDRRDGIFFVSPDDDGLLAARQVASLLNGKTIELPESGLQKDTFDKEIGRVPCSPQPLTTRPAQHMASMEDFQMAKGFTIVQDRHGRRSTKNGQNHCRVRRP